MTSKRAPAWALPTSKTDHQRTLPPTMSSPAEMERRSQLWPQIGLDLGAYLAQLTAPVAPYLKKIPSRRSGPRGHEGRDILLPAGYVAEVVAEEFDAPVDVAFDGAGTAYVFQSGHKSATPPRVYAVDLDTGSKRLFFEFPADRWFKAGALTGGTWHDGSLYVANTDTISRITPDGRLEDLVTGLPGRGDHQVNPPRVGPDGRLYFAVGSATNSGIVGPDNAAFEWLPEFPDVHDVPAFDVTLAGRNMESHDVLGDQRTTVTTGAFVPYRTETQAGQVIPGSTKSTAVLRCDLDGGNLEVVAWGLRNPYGIDFHPDGRLFVTEHGLDSRNRHIIGDYDDFYEIVQGAWYGWPDYASGIRLDDPRWGTGGTAREPLLAVPPDPDPPKPFVTFEPHVAANGFAFAPDGEFGFPGDAFVALFGDLAPVTTPRLLEPKGYKVVRVDMAQRRVVDFAVNRIEGPASKLPHAGFERPSHCAFGPDGSLYVVDFGEIDIAPEVAGVRMQARTGTLWRIRRTGGEAGTVPPPSMRFPFYVLQLGTWIAVPLGLVGVVALARRLLGRRR